VCPIAHFDQPPDSAPKPINVAYPDPSVPPLLDTLIANEFTLLPAFVEIYNLQFGFTPIPTLF
jgi:hypothetical protein